MSGLVFFCRDKNKMVRNPTECSMHRKRYFPKGKDYKQVGYCLDMELLGDILQHLFNVSPKRMSRAVRVQKVIDWFQTDNARVWPFIIHQMYKVQGNTMLQSIVDRIQQQLKPRYEPLPGSADATTKHVELTVKVVNEILSQMMQAFPRKFWSLGVVTINSTIRTAITQTVLDENLHQFVNAIVARAKRGKKFIVVSGMVLYNGNHYTSGVIIARLTKVKKQVIDLIPISFDSLQPANTTHVQKYCDKIVTQAQKDTVQCVAHDPIVLSASPLQKDGVSCGVWSLASILHVINHNTLSISKIVEKFQQTTTQASIDELRSDIYYRNNVTSAEEFKHIRHKYKSREVDDIVALSSDDD